MTLEQLGVDLVQAHLGDDGRVQLHVPLAAHLAHDHVGDHVLQLRGAEAPARARVEAADAVAHGLDLGGRAAQRARHGAHVLGGQAVQVLGDDVAGHLAGVFVVDRGQLSQQAFGDAARGHAGRLQRLHALEGDLHLLQRGGRVEVGHLDHLLQVGAQVAVVVQRLDDHLGQHQVAQRQRQHRQLAVQVRGERGGHGHHVERAGLVVVGTLARPEAVGLPHVAVALAGQVALGRCHGLGGGLLGLAGLLGLGGLLRGEAFVALVVGIAVLLEERVLAQGVVDLLGELERGELQQPNGVLQAGGQRLRLALFRTEVHRTHWFLLSGGAAPARVAGFAFMPRRIATAMPGSRIEGKPPTHLV